MGINYLFKQIINGLRIIFFISKKIINFQENQNNHLALSEKRKKKINQSIKHQADPCRMCQENQNNHLALSKLKN